MSDFLEDGDFPLGLLEGGYVLGDPAEPTFSREAGHNFYGDILANIEVAGQLDFAMNTAANLLDNLVMVDDLAAGGEVSIDIGDMCPAVHIVSTVLLARSPAAALATLALSMPPPEEPPARSRRPCRPGQFQVSRP